MNFNDLILLLDSRLENLKQLSSMEIPYKVDGDGTEFFKTKDGYRIEDHGFIEWRNKMDVVHRTDGPAFEHPNGSKEWWVHGKHHRIDGPAVEHVDDINNVNVEKEWYVNGKQMSEEQFNQWRARHNPIKESRIENLKQLASMEIPYRVYGDGTEVYKTKEGFRYENPNGSKEWYVNGELHRIDGPAIEVANGDRFWYVNGERHRTDGPAVEQADGRKAWFVNDKRHRTDGPAIEFADGRKAWYIHGKKMSEKQFDKWRAKKNPIKESRAENLKQLSLMEIPYKVDNDGTEVYKTKDGYRVEDIDGFKVWYNAKGKLHRLDGPAIEQPNGTKAWYVNGERHRLDGPAIEHAGGHKEWFVNDAQLSKEQFNRRAKNNLSR